MICIPIVAESTKEALSQIKEAGIADLIELRLDLIRDISEKNLELLLKKSKKTVIVTDRKKRINLIQRAIELNSDFIDVDVSFGEKSIRKLKEIIADKSKSRLIISFHNFKKTDKQEISKEYEQIKKLNPDIIKIATFANSINDNIIIFDLIKKSKRENTKIIALCMGEKGEISRILGVFLGSQLIFGSLRAGAESAPGQITASALKKIYRVNQLRNPKIFGLVGNPVSHSKGIFIHNKAFAKNKINAVYVNFLVEDIVSFIRDFKGIISGVSVTIPHKREIINHLDSVDRVASKVGAVNTIINKNGRLVGYNTDIDAAIKSIELKTKIKGNRVLMIGAGGVARAIGYGVVMQGGKLIISNRTQEKAKKLAKELKCDFYDINKLDELRGTDIVINATSIGMEPNILETPIPKNTLKKIMAKNGVVFDSVYVPKETKLLKDAKGIGFRVVFGETMFINQAAMQFELFCSKKW